MSESGNRRPWLTPVQALRYLRQNYALSYTIDTLYSKSSRGEIPVERPSGKGGPIRFDPDKLDSWARGEWTPATHVSA
jgi:hypothetical protein